MSRASGHESKNKPRRKISFDVIQALANCKYKRGSIDDQVSSVKLNKNHLMRFGVEKILSEKTKKKKPKQTLIFLLRGRSFLFFVQILPPWHRVKFPVDP